MAGLTFAGFPPAIRHEVLAGLAVHLQELQGQYVLYKLARHAVAAHFAGHYVHLAGLLVPHKVAHDARRAWTSPPSPLSKKEGGLAFRLSF